MLSHRDPKYIRTEISTRIQERKDREIEQVDAYERLFSRSKRAGERSSCTAAATCSSVTWGALADSAMVVAREQIDRAPRRSPDEAARRLVQMSIESCAPIVSVITCRAKCTYWGEDV